MVDLDQLPEALRELIAELTEVPPTIEKVDLDTGSEAGDYFRADEPSDSSSSWWDVRMRVLGLIGSCPSLTHVNVSKCGISRESEMQRLCEGLTCNKVLRKLVVDGNRGFGSDFGCLQVSRILASSTALATLQMDSVGMRVTGLSHIVGALVGNPGSRLDALDVENNPELGGEGSGELLAQVLSDPNTSKWLTKLRIGGIGLTVAGAARLSVGMAQNKTLKALQVGGSPGLEAAQEEERGPIKTVLMSLGGSIIQLVLTFSQEKGLAECLAEMLQRNRSSLEELYLLEGRFSTEEWRFIFRALASVTTLTYLAVRECSSMDHNVIEDLQQLVASNPRLRIQDIDAAPLKGGSEHGFYCSCPSCLADASVGAAAIKGHDLEQLPPALRALISELKAVRPTIQSVELGAGSEAGDYFRKPFNGEAYTSGWWDVRRWVLGLIARCPSLRLVDVSGCGIAREPEVRLLCEGLKSNTVLKQLVLDGNTGFGTEFGCREVNSILASSTTLEALQMDNVGLRAKGLSLLVEALVGNKGSRLQLLDVENNRELGDEASGDSLAQLLSNPHTSKWLRHLRIKSIGLTAAGAARLSAALAQNSTLGSLHVGPGPLKTILSSVRCSLLSLFCNGDSGLAAALIELLRTNSLKKIYLYYCNFSTLEWRSIFEALATSTLATFSMDNSNTLDHDLIDDLQQLLAVNSSLYIPDIGGSPLKGRSRRGFHCCCTSCSAASDAIAAEKLTSLMDQLGATDPSITRIGVEDLEQKGTQGQLQDGGTKRRVLELIGTCSSLNSVTFPKDFVGRDDREGLHALCTGMASNPVLRELSLEGNPGFGSDYGCAQLAKVVSGCIRTLKDIDMFNVNMKSTGLAYLTHAWQESDAGTAESISGLDSLNLGNNNGLGDAGAVLVAQLLRSRSCSRLEFLNIAHTGMGVTGAQALSLALRHNTSITQLAIGESCTEAPEGEEPVDVLLRSLIHHPSVANEGSGAHGPVDNKTVTRLVLYNGERAEILAQILETNTTIRTLRLKNCLYGVEDWRRIFKALEKNEALRVLDLTVVGLDLEPVLNDLLELLQVNTTLQQIKLDGTDLSRKGKVPLVEEALRRNKQQAEYLAVLKAKLPLVQPSTGRLFLCGSPYAGKSTLRESMVRWHRKRNMERAISSARALLLGQLRSLRPRTRGIEIEVLRDDEDMQISIWDMAGQEQYHALHDHLFPNTNQACMFIFVYNPVYGHSSKHGVLDEHHFREELLYWLRFIASNSRSTGHSLPLVSIVITHLDKLPAGYNAGKVVNWAEATVVASLRHQFAGVIEVHSEVFAVRANSAASVGPIVDRHIFDHFEQLLQHKLPPVIGACGQMSLALARRTLQPSTHPMVRAEEFFKMCATEVEALRDLLEDHGSASVSGTAVAAYVSKAKHAVAAYLHDVGSIVHFRDLDFIVVNPNWLGNVFLSKFIRFGAELRRDGMLPSTDDGFIDEFELKELLAEFLLKSGSICSGFSEADLLQLLVKLELCYKEESTSSISLSPPRVRYFVPSSLADGSGLPLRRTSSNIMCPLCFTGGSQLSSPEVVSELKWQVRVKDEAACTHIGIRLQCEDDKRTLLTPGLFPRLQVYLRRVLQETHTVDLSSKQYCNEYNLIRIFMNGCEILVQSGGDSGTFIDILVRAEDKPRHETSELVQRVIVKEIQAFCMTPQGCPGVALIQCVIRPECVVALTPCLDRRDQAVPVEALKMALVANFLSKTEVVDEHVVMKKGGEDGEERLDERLSYDHYWPTVPNSDIGKGFTKAIHLLQTHDLVEILEREKATLTKAANLICKAVSEVQGGDGIVPLIADSDDLDNEEPEDACIPTRSMSRLQRLTTSERRIHSHMDRIEQKLDEQKDLLLKIVPSLVKELKTQQHEMQEALTRGVDDVVSFMRDLQNTQMPRFPYFSDKEVSTYQRFVAFFRVGSALKLHFMCEDRSGMHFVENQEGCDLIIEEPQYATLRCVALCSAKILYILVKAGLQIGAGAGGIVPEFTNCAGDIIPIATDLMGDVLNDIKLNDQYSASNQADAVTYLQDFVKGKHITSAFQLHRVEYLHPSVGGKSPRFGWVCGKCRTRGLLNQSVKDCL